MPIGTNIVIVRKILDITAPDDGNFPASSGDAAVRWADVADALLAEVVPVSTTAPAARAAFIPIVAAISFTTPSGIAILKAAFMQYAVILATGMNGAGFAGTPPPAPPLFETVLTGVSTEAMPIANALAVLLITWAHTGTATPLSGGTPITWN